MMIRIARVHVSERYDLDTFLSIRPREIEIRELCPTVKDVHLCTPKYEYMGQLIGVFGQID